MQRAATTQFWIAPPVATRPIHQDLTGYERTVERTLQLLRANAAVLEIGCGTGTTALRLAPSVSRIRATDVSAEMIAIAREKAAMQQARNVTFDVAPASADLGSEAPYEAVLAFNLLHLVSHRAEVFAEVRRLSSRAASSSPRPPVSWK